MVALWARSIYISDVHPPEDYRMARARKSHKQDEEDTKYNADGLQPAYSVRVDGHRYVIYASYRKDDNLRMLVLKFLSTYAARFMVDKLIGQDKYKTGLFMDRDTMLTTEAGITIRAAGNQILEILHYELNDRERAWEDTNVSRAIAQFKYGKAPDDNPGTRHANDDSPERETIHVAVTKRRDRIVRQPKEPKQPKADTSGHISANDIAAELGVEGREVRGVLRSLKLTKPSHGWSWPKGEAEAIKKQIVEGLKQAKKGKKG